MFAGGWGQNKGALPNRCDVRIPSLSSIHGCFLAGSPVSLSLRCDKRTRDAEPGSANISKKDMEFLIAKASETAPAQTIRIESGPVKIVPDTK